MRSFTRTRAALERQLRVVHRRHRRGAIVEAFIDGIDLYVTAIEGRTLHLRPPHELRVKAPDSPARSMATYHGKHSDAYRKRWKFSPRLAKLDAKTMRELDGVVRRLWPVLQLRDYAR